MQTKQRRSRIRLWIFCLSFLILAAGFGIGFRVVSRRQQISRYNLCAGSLTALNEYAVIIRDTAQTLAEDNRYPFVRTISEAAGGAKNTLTQIPFSEQTRENLQRFFTDTSAFLTELAGQESLPNGSQRELARQMSDYADQLGLALSVLLLPDDRMTILEDTALYLAPVPPDIPREEEAVSPVPRLITEAEAKAIARQYLGGNLFLTRIPGQEEVYRFLGGSTFADIRRSDGALIRLFSGKSCQEIRLDRTDARMYAEAFLQKEGFSSFILTDEYIRAGRYHAIYRTSGGKRIAAGISLDRGRVVFYDASEYYRTN